MRRNISDLLDGYIDDSVDLKGNSPLSASRIQELMMMKMAQKKPVRHWGNCCRTFPLVAIVAVLLSMSVLANIRWNGFVRTGGMSGAEMRAMMREASTAYAGKFEDKDGTVHYLDRDGNETLNLSAEKAEEYERGQIVEHEQSVKNSTTLVDPDTMPLLPSGITEMETDVNGGFSDFMLGNGHMILLHPDGGKGYSLRGGDTLTISLDSDDSCILSFALFQNGAFVREETMRAQRHQHTFDISESGLYCVAVMYGSAGASTFTNCGISIAQGNPS